MVIKTFYLKDLDQRFKDTDANFTFYQSNLNTDLPHPAKRPGLFICPGGGYQFVSNREAEPVALSFICEGFNCFVLTYSINKMHPIPHLEAAFAMNYIREHYQDFDLIDENLSIIGFSAGGHLATSFAYLYPRLADSLHVNPKNIRPFAVIAGYPVISTDLSFSHEGTIRTIAGDDKELNKLLSVENNITKDYPPTFVYHSEDDGLVPVKNSYVFIEALKANNIPYQADIFSHAVHGGSIYLRGVYDDFQETHKKALDNFIWVRHASEFIFSFLEK